MGAFDSSTTTGVGSTSEPTQEAPVTDLADAPTSTPSDPDEWHKSVCILCSANCGVEIKLDGRNFKRIRGNKAHVASEG